MDIARRLKQKIKKKDDKDLSTTDENEGKLFKKSFSKKSKKTGLPISFEDRKSKIDTQVRFKPKVAAEFIILNPQSKGNQSDPDVFENQTQTPIISFSESSMNHLEGGWPKVINFY